MIQPTFHVNGSCNHNSSWKRSCGSLTWQVILGIVWIVDYHTEEDDDIVLDDFGLPKGHACATDVEVVDNKHTTIDHLCWFQCAGFGKYSFAEVQHIPRKVQPARADTV
eukprot:1231171-Ditylum_brightwellii.AAC.1